MGKLTKETSKELTMLVIEFQTDFSMWKLTQ